MLTWRSGGSGLRALVPVTGMALLLGSCSETGLPGPHAQETPGESQAFFAAAVSYSARRSETPVRVDPRPVRAEAQLHAITESDIVTTDSATIRLRMAALAAEGIPLADAVQDWRCVFAEGMRGPPPGEKGGNDPIWEQIRAGEPDSVRAQREACRRDGRYTSLVFGPPQPGTDPEHPRWWRIRAMRMMLHGWEVVDLFLERTADGAWEVVRMQERVGSFS